MGLNDKVKAFLPVYVYNSVEDEWTYISGLKKEKERNVRIELSNAYADSYLFANSGRKIFVFISPVPIPEEFKTYYEKLTNSKVTVIHPKMSGPFICRNLIDDKDALNQLIMILRKYPGISLFPYATTPYLYELKKEIEKKGIRVNLPESPREDDFWTVSTYGSKSGFRELITSRIFKNNRILLPSGMILDSIEDALNLTSSALEEKGAVLLKISRGSGGHGTYILKKDNPLHNREYIKSILTSNPLWKKNKIIVEDYIETDPSHSTQYPSIECIIDGSGKNRILYCCNMLVTPEGNFYGMEMGNEAIPVEIKRKMHTIGRNVGGLYAASGYRGHFDIDMIHGKDRLLYVNESNVRNTGGTDAYKMAAYLLGPRLLGKSFLLSKFIDFPKTDKLPPFNSILEILKSILYSPVTKTGIVVSSQSALRENSITYFIIERSKKEAYATENKLLSLISHIK